MYSQLFLTVNAIAACGNISVWALQPTNLDLMARLTVTEMALVTSRLLIEQDLPNTNLFCLLTFDLSVHRWAVILFNLYCLYITYVLSS
jgi:hypothetical protein